MVSWNDVKEGIKIILKIQENNIAAEKVKTQKKKVASIRKLDRKLDKLDTKMSIHIIIAISFFILGYVISYFQNNH